MNSADELCRCCVRLVTDCEKEKGVNALCKDFELNKDVIRYREEVITPVIDYERFNR